MGENSLLGKTQIGGVPRWGAAARAEFSLPVLGFWRLGFGGRCLWGWPRTRWPLVQFDMFFRGVPVPGSDTHAHGLPVNGRMEILAVAIGGLDPHRVHRLFQTQKVHCGCRRFARPCDGNQRRIGIAGPHLVRCKPVSIALRNPWPPATSCNAR